MGAGRPLSSVLPVLFLHLPPSQLLLLPVSLLRSHLTPVSHPPSHPPVEDDKLRRRCRWPCPCLRWLLLLLLLGRALGRRGRGALQRGVHLRLQLLLGLPPQLHLLLQRGLLLLGRGELLLQGHLDSGLEGGAARVGAAAVTITHDPHAQYAGQLS